MVVIMIGGELLIDWGYRCLAAEVDDSKDQIVHVCWKAECNSWKRLQLWRGEATKAWRANDTHFGGAKQFTFYQILLRCSKGFCPVFWGRVTVDWDWGEKHIELTNVRWCPCMSSKAESWTRATEGRAEQTLPSARACAKINDNCCYL